MRLSLVLGGSLAIAVSLLGSSCAPLIESSEITSASNQTSCDVPEFRTVVASTEEGVVPDKTKQLLLAYAKVLAKQAAADHADAGQLGVQLATKPASKDYPNNAELIALLRSLWQTERTWFAKRTSKILSQSGDDVLKIYTQLGDRSVKANAAHASPAGNSKVLSLHIRWHAG